MRFSKFISFKRVLSETCKNSLLYHFFQVEKRDSVEQESETNTGPTENPVPLNDSEINQEEDNKNEQ